MDKELRNILRNTVTKCRKLLEDAVGELLEGQFGIHRTGKVEDADKLKHLGEGDQEYRAQVLAHYEHIKAAGFKPADAMGQLIREVAFTHLNRLCAYKLMEKRGLIRESVSRGLKSQGVSFHLADHPADEKLWDTGKQDVSPTGASWRTSAPASPTRSRSCSPRTTRPTGCSRPSGCSMMCWS
jgi:hypothetical protein